MTENETWECYVIRDGRTLRIEVSYIIDDCRPSIDEYATIMESCTDIPEPMAGERVLLTHDELSTIEHDINVELAARDIDSVYDRLWDDRAYEESVDK